jgi:hypothetical protein
VEDETTLAYGTYQLAWQSGPCLIGNSAEIIVERPFGDSNNFYPLANYIWDFSLSWAYNLRDVEYGPGATTPATQIFSMYDDNFTQVISQPVVEGKYSVSFYDTVAPIPVAAFSRRTPSLTRNAPSQFGPGHSGLSSRPVRCPGARDFTALALIAVGNNHCYPGHLRRDNLRVPDDLARISGRESYLLLGWFL